MKRYPLDCVRVIQFSDEIVATVYRNRYRKSRRIVIDDLPDRHWQRLTRALNHMRVQVELLDHIEVNYLPR
jgi:hypothetical protein